MNLDITKYPGSKGASGVKEFLINNTPKCEFFVDGFGGSGFVSESIAKLEKNIQILYFEIVKHVFKQFKEASTLPGIICFNENVIEHYLNNLSKKDKSDLQYFFEETVFFFDPPYLFETRRTIRPMYDYEWTLEQHIEFLAFVRLLSEKTRAKIMITHPECDTYNALLVDGYTDKEWTAQPFAYMGRGGKIDDMLWTNFNPKEEVLLSYKYVGDNNTDRQRIKRKSERWTEKIKALPFHEQQAIVTEIASLKCS